MSLQSYLNSVWYGDRGGHWLRPLAGLYGWVVKRRLRAFRTGQRAVYRAPVPVIVIGNHTVGGTGKTPLVIEIVERLKRRGHQPAVISRGYGSTITADAARTVDATSRAADVGDEPLLIFTRTRVPVAVCPNRRYACEAVLAAGATVIVADDGLQHLALARDVEIDVVDAVRGFGNGRCLPAGPLRVPPEALWSTGLQIANGGCDGHAMSLEGQHARRLVDGELVPMTEFDGQRVHAVAGIGHPDRFFCALRDHGLEVIEHPLDDHADVSPSQIEFGDDLPVLMTEKDAVKLPAALCERYYSVPVNARLSASASAAVDALLDGLSDNTRL
ncbi:MAG: tetraacyldisaccharide 4'-kinase [Gammaproteobacteria bacterium]